LTRLGRFFVLSVSLSLSLSLSLSPLYIDVEKVYIYKVYIGIYTGPFNRIHFTYTVLRSTCTFHDFVAIKRVGC
jgi:hypothetical protein